MSWYSIILAFLSYSLPSVIGLPFLTEIGMCHRGTSCARAARHRLYSAGCGAFASQYNLKRLRNHFWLTELLLSGVVCTLILFFRVRAYELIYRKNVRTVS